MGAAPEQEKEGGKGRKKDKKTKGKERKILQKMLMHNTLNI